MVSNKTSSCWVFWTISH